MIRRLSSFILDILQVIVFAVAIFLFIYLLILQPHKIHGQSMVPSFQDGEFLLTDKLSYRFNDPQRGDVVVFKAPPDGKDEFIKRIIATPTDRIMIKEGGVVLNGRKLIEPYLSPGETTQPSSFATEGKELLVPENSYFVMGDNRGHSYDSRSFGFVTRDKITGKAWFIYWPPAETGTVEKVSIEYVP